MAPSWHHLSFKLCWDGCLRTARPFFPIIDAIRYENGLTPKEIARLDWFEDVEYTRRPVIVTMDAKETATETYVWTNPLSELQLDAEWSIEDFTQTHLTRFLVQTVQPCCIRMKREGL